MQIRTRQAMVSPRCHFLKVANSLSANKHLFVEFALIYLIRVCGMGYIMLGNATIYLCWAIVDHVLVGSHEAIRTCLGFDLPHWISVVESLVFFGT